MEDDLLKLKETIQTYNLRESKEIKQKVPDNIDQDDLNVKNFIIISEIFQFWANHKYNTNLLDYHISFPLLRKLVQVREPIAKKVFYDEIIKHLWGGDPLFVKFLIRERYDDYVKLESYKSRIHIPKSFNDLKLTFFLILFLIILHFILEQNNIVVYFRLERIKIFENYEIWRYFTSMFAHSLRIHLVVNICMLIFFSSIFEINNLFSYRSYIIIYLISGLVGNFFFFAFSLEGGDYGAGASGCVFGIIGALTIITIKKQRYYWTIILLLITGIFLFQSLDPEINFSAHLFGFLTGMIVNLLIYRINSNKQKKKYRIEQSP
ncbi:MAG: rhomboid family intramembrane serine protease [Candidatus Lokiarchaeota archaeon]|nr:rhomboid family intramembrane serine protease [Candidatus Lokiarchaeota archaeon]